MITIISPRHISIDPQTSRDVVFDKALLFAWFVSKLLIKLLTFKLSIMPTCYFHKRSWKRRASCETFSRSLLMNHSVSAPLSTVSWAVEITHDFTAFITRRSTNYFLLGIVAQTLSFCFFFNATIEDKFDISFQMNRFARGNA